MESISRKSPYYYSQSTFESAKEVVLKEDPDLSSNYIHPASDERDDYGSGNSVYNRSTRIFELIPNEVSINIGSYMNNRSLNAMRQVSLAAHNAFNGLWERQIPLDNITEAEINNFYAYYRSLDVSCLAITIISAKTGLLELIQSLSENDHLKEIKLIVKGVGLESVDVDIAHLAKLTKLTELNISSDKLGVGDAAHLTKLTKLTKLTLSRLWPRFEQGLGPDDAASMAKLTNLILLSINDNDLGWEGAAHVAKLTKLILLNIGYNELGPVGAAHLTSLTNLTSLVIEGNELGTDGLAHLTKLRELASLDVSNNNLGPEGSSHLTTLTNLTSLNIKGNGECF
jgi:hypothetical protein